MKPVRFVLFLCLVLCASRVFGEPPSFEAFDKKARTDQRLNIVFLGASLTWGANATDPLLTSYRADIARKFEQEYPAAHFTFWDASIGGTGSQLGVFRLDRDVLAHHPDMVFVDFTSNDGMWQADPERCASYEAIVRRIIDEGHSPVVQMILPFKGDAARLKLDTFKLRDAHYAISKAYQTGMGDAMQLIQDRLRDGKATLDQIWPTDGVHPGDFGYALFAEAGWNGFTAAREAKQVCQSPQKMLFGDAYMHSIRVRLAGLSPLPEGWVAGRPNLTSAYYDMLMSRWLDSELIGSNRREQAANGRKQRVAQPIGSLKATVHGRYVLLFGESTPKTGKIRILVDGKPISRPGLRKTDVDPPDVFDPGRLGKAANGNAHFNIEVANNLSAATDHVVEVIPVFSSEQEEELRIESICVAGENPSVALLPSAATQPSTQPTTGEAK